MSATEAVHEMISAALTAPSKEFGYLVPEINHELLGRLARTRRLEVGVRAVDVAKVLEVTKVQLHFLESGHKHWTLKTLKKYMETVFRLAVKSDNGRPDRASSTKFRN